MATADPDSEPGARGDDQRRTPSETTGESSRGGVAGVTGSNADTDPDELAAVADRLRSAAFVHLVARADGDGVAAAGLIGRACRALGRPVQVSVGATADDRVERAERAVATARDGDATVLVGDPTTESPAGALRVPADDRPASDRARAVAARLLDGRPAEPDRTLALAGAVAAGRREAVTDPADRADGGPADGDVGGAGDVERRPGVATPVADPVDGLAHSTLVHAPFSGDPEAAREAVHRAGVDPDAADASGDGGASPLEESDCRRLASLVALSVAGDDRATATAAGAVERAVRPLSGRGPFATVEGYADVLSATARSAPGTAVALALGRPVREAALEAWRDHGRRAHRAVRAASTGRYDGLVAAQFDAGDVPVRTVAELLAAHRSPEPVVLAVDDGRAGLAGPGAGAALRRAATSVDAPVRTDAAGDRGYAAFDADDATTLVAAVREALS